MNKSLYKIEQEYIDFIDAVEQLDGELTPEMEKQLAINEEERNEKSLAYSQVIDAKTSRIELIDSEIKRLQAMKKREQKTVERLKNALVTAVQIFGEFEYKLHKFGTRKSSTVEVEDVNALPKEYKVTKITEQADKNAIKKALQNGEKIKGCRIVEHQNLKIS